MSARPIPGLGRSACTCFKKQAGGNLDLLYNWPVSTGPRARRVRAGRPAGAELHAQGYYEIDPDRMYKAPRFRAVGHADALCDVLQLAGRRHADRPCHPRAHGADIALLGQRASAGCVRLAPEHAAQLFGLIRTQYRGLAPRFAVDRRTATMNNQGLLMHDAQGRVQLAEGFKVLVFIENYGGENIVAAIF